MTTSEKNFGERKNFFNKLLAAKKSEENAINKQEREREEEEEEEEKERDGRQREKGR